MGPLRSGADEADSEHPLRGHFAAGYGTAGCEVRVASAVDLLEADSEQETPAGPGDTPRRLLLVAAAAVLAFALTDPGVHSAELSALRAARATGEEPPATLLAIVDPAFVCKHLGSALPPFFIGMLQCALVSVLLTLPSAYLPCPREERHPLNPNFFAIAYGSCHVLAGMVTVWQQLFSAPLVSQVMTDQMGKYVLRFWGATAAPRVLTTAVVVAHMMLCIWWRSRGNPDRHGVGTTDGWIWSTWCAAGLTVLGLIALFPAIFLGFTHLLPWVFMLPGAILHGWRQIALWEAVLAFFIAIVCIGIVGGAVVSAGTRLVVSRLTMCERCVDHSPADSAEPGFQNVHTPAMCALRATLSALAAFTFVTVAQDLTAASALLFGGKTAMRDVLAQVHNGRVWCEWGDCPYDSWLPEAVSWLELTPLLVSAVRKLRPAECTDAKCTCYLPDGSLIDPMWPSRMECVFLALLVGCASAYFVVVHPGRPAVTLLKELARLKHSYPDDGGLVQRLIEVGPNAKPPEVQKAVKAYCLGSMQKRDSQYYRARRFVASPLHLRKVLMRPDFCDALVAEGWNVNECSFADNQEGASNTSMRAASASLIGAADAAGSGDAVRTPRYSKVRTPIQFAAWYIDPKKQPDEPAESPPLSPAQQRVLKPEETPFSKTFKVLLDRHALAHDPPADLVSPLWASEVLKNSTAVSFCLESDRALYNPQDPDHEALKRVARDGSEESLIMLLTRGFDKRLARGPELSVLHLKSVLEDTDLVRALVQSKHKHAAARELRTTAATPDAYNSPLDFACALGCTESAKIMIDADAYCGAGKPIESLSILRHEELLAHCLRKEKLTVETSERPIRQVVENGVSWPGRGENGVCTPWSQVALRLLMENTVDRKGEPLTSLLQLPWLLEHGNCLDAVLKHWPDLATNNCRVLEQPTPDTSPLEYLCRLAHSRSECPRTRQPLRVLPDDAEAAFSAAEWLIARCSGAQPGQSNPAHSWDVLRSKRLVQACCDAGLPVDENLPGTDLSPLAAAVKQLCAPAGVGHAAGSSPRSGGSPRARLALSELPEDRGKCYVPLLHAEAPRATTVLHARSVLKHRDIVRDYLGMDPHAVQEEMPEPAPDGQRMLPLDVCLGAIAERQRPAWQVPLPETPTQATGAAQFVAEDRGGNDTLAYTATAMELISRGAQLRRPGGPISPLFSDTVLADAELLVAACLAAEHRPHMLFDSSGRSAIENAVRKGFPAAAAAMINPALKKELADGSVAEHGGALTASMDSALASTSRSEPLDRLSATEQGQAELARAVERALEGLRDPEPTEEQRLFHVLRDEAIIREASFVKFLLDCNWPTMPSDGSEPPLLKAVDLGCAHSVQELLFREASRAKAVSTPSQIPVATQESPAAGQTFASVQDRSPDARDVEMEQPLDHRAAPAARSATPAQPLASLSYCDENGRTALHRALAKLTGSKERQTWCPVVRILLEHGADPRVRDNEHATPGDLAKADADLHRILTGDKTPQEMATEIAELPDQARSSWGWLPFRK
eukprot:TRINITY_DN2008_c0_g1_i1.p1 TRINITY_DN2008_c0_g1~~TRINITY_DN2008_c0_g1_i1.p1  ORF type:complete len:1528 (+),score=297.84 TRINITY_DN2008_c0_g1_i1:102-4685(+)